MSDHIDEHKNKTMMVTILTAITMVIEIIFGLSTNSMALLADGIHMGSHVLAIGLSWLAYITFKRVNDNGKFPGNASKILSLSGYSSGLMLLIFAIVILFEAVKRFYNPAQIHFTEAIIVAFAGLVVNIVSALLLRHKREYSDHNIRAAYLHVLADALTSISAITGLTIAMIFDVLWIDALVAIISSFIILRWSVSLLKDSGKVLLDITNE
jgi:cation diffusion facilitator family transporter